MLYTLRAPKSLNRVRQCATAERRRLVNHTDLGVNKERVQDMRRVTFVTTGIARPGLRLMNARAGLGN